MSERILSHADLLKLKRWNTPTIYNGWEAITKNDTTKGHFNLDPVTDYTPTMGIMIGYAVTVTIQPSKKEHSLVAGAWQRYREYIAKTPGPKIVIVKDLDHPHIGSFWGEVNSNFHRAFGCVGTITDGAVRDIDEMHNAGFHAIARQMCVGHGFSTPVSWDEPVEVFGCTIKPGDLVHADKHGFLVVPPEDQAALYDASVFMDSNECEHSIMISRSVHGMPTDEALRRVEEEYAKFGAATREKFGKKGEF